MAATTRPHATPARPFADELSSATYGPPVSLAPLAPLSDPDAFELDGSPRLGKRRPIVGERPADLPNQTRMF